MLSIILSVRYIVTVIAIIGFTYRCIYIIRILGSIKILKSNYFICKIFGL